LAERTLYLPSMGLSLVVAGLTAPALGLTPSARRGVVVLVAALGVILFVGTVNRNPSWMSTFVVIQTLNDQHPESWRAFRGRAQGLERVGEEAGAGEAWDAAVSLNPRNYGLLVQAGEFHARLGNWATSRAYLVRANEVAPGLLDAYRLHAAHLLRRGMGREGHGVALEGLAKAGPDRELWSLVSESYLLKGDLPAAIRARLVAIGLEPEAPEEWQRLGEIWEAMGDDGRAQEAWAQAQALAARGGSKGGIGP
jgi:tetratricopeptide (TPR) repeat protein